MRIITKFYLLQLTVSFLLTVLTINLMGGLALMESSGTIQVVILWIVPGLFISFLNALINSLNFTYPKKKNSFIAFYLPNIIWGILLLITISEAVESNGTKLSDWATLLIWLEPIVYNFILEGIVKKRIPNNSELIENSLID